MFTIAEYVYEIFSRNKRTGDFDSTDIAMAKVMSENADKRDAELDKKVREFWVKKYFDIGKFGTSCDYDRNVFIPEVEKMYEAYLVEKELDRIALEELEKQDTVE